MEEIIEKLKDILASEDKKNIKTKDIAKALKINPNTFNSMKFRNSIPYKHILNFLQERSISINYFFYGNSPKENLECESTYRILKLYKTNASLGGGGINDDVEVEHIILDNKMLDFFKTKNCDLITCLGESMESEIIDGSICIVDKNKALKDKGIYAINTKDGLFVKQVFIKDKGIVLHSLNPIYKDMFYKNGEFLIIGAIIGVIKTINHNTL